jgi:hypothetical protein
MRSEMPKSTMKLTLAARGTVFVDRVFGRAERKSAVLLGAIEDPVFWIEVGKIR